MKEFGYDCGRLPDGRSDVGSDADADRLIERRTAPRPQLMIDMLLLPHCSDRHAWFQRAGQSRDNPKADWFVWADPRRDGTPPTNWLSIFGGPAWTFDPRRGQYLLALLPEGAAQSQLAQPGRGRGHARYPRARWRSGSTEGSTGYGRMPIDHPAARCGAARQPTGDARPADRHGRGGGQPVRPPDAPVRPRPAGRFSPASARSAPCPTATATATPWRKSATWTRSRSAADTPPGRGCCHSYYMFQLTHDEIDSGLSAPRRRTYRKPYRRRWTTYTLGNHDTERLVTRFGRDPNLSGDPPGLAKLMLALITSLAGRRLPLSGRRTWADRGRHPVRTAGRPVRHRFLAGLTRGATAAAPRCPGRRACPMPASPPARPPWLA